MVRIEEQERVLCHGGFLIASGTIALKERLYDRAETGPRMDAA